MCSSECPYMGHGCIQCCAPVSPLQGKTTEGYLTSFKWDAAKFNVNTSLKGLCEDVISKVTDIDNEMKKKVSAYNKAKQGLNVMEKEQTGALMTRSLDGLVKKEVSGVRWWWGWPRRRDGGADINAHPNLYYRRCFSSD